MRTLLRFLFLSIVPVTALSCHAAEDTRPNILFCIADDWGWPHAGAYGSKFVETPTFDRLAEEGILFRNCFTSNPKCAPCRASITTGRNSWQLGRGVDHFNRWPEQFITFPDLFMEAGYHVGLTGKGWGPGNWKDYREHNPAGPLYDKYRTEAPGEGMSNRDYARNFIENFLPERQEGQPFLFWLGTNEPHRGYEDGNGLRRGKKLEDVEVPAFFPDTKTVRSDLLDYAIEVEWYDTHVGRVIDHLEKIGELENTIVVMTSDHGMPFPRVKGQIYEMGYHLPLSVRWGNQVTAGRQVDDFINVRDFAPTFLEAAGIDIHSQMTGKSFVDVLKAKRSGIVDSSRNTMLIGKERHDLGRPNDWGYPVRAIRTKEFLYVYNFEPERWPAGNPETGYRNVDGSPTKSAILGSFNEYYSMSFGKRPQVELYRIVDDPECVENLAYNPENEALIEGLHKRLMGMLKEEGDPRLNGNAEFFDTIEYVGGNKHSWDSWMEAKEAQ